MSFCSSPERKTTFLPLSGFGPEVGPSHTVCGPAYLTTAALASATTLASSARPAGAKAVASRTLATDRNAVCLICLVILILLYVPRVGDFRKRRDVASSYSDFRAAESYARLPSQVVRIRYLSTRHPGESRDPPCRLGFLDLKATGLYPATRCGTVGPASAGVTMIRRANI